MGFIINSKKSRNKWLERVAEKDESKLVLPISTKILM